ncbi:MAG TPA: amidohydrolase family protein [Clostridia bacterium]|nr:amidohydrolase family protein [Clostridia bacterium]
MTKQLSGITLIKGHIIEAKTFGDPVITENGYLVVENGVVKGVFVDIPAEFAGAKVEDYSGKLILQGFSDMHLHAPQYPMLGMGMDLPLMDWLKAYTFKTEARFADNGFAREVYARLAQELVNNGTTRVCIYSSTHVGATLILMEELEKAGVGGYVGKVNMDRASGECQEQTEESMRETLRWLDESARFTHVKPILTPRFTPSCSNELMDWLGKVAKERGIYVQSHLSENKREIELVKELHPDCEQYWQTYDKYGLWTDHTIMAHCVHSDQLEQQAMIDHNVLCVHCPDSNINICSGFAPVRQMKERGVWLALGSDIAGGAQLPMLQVLTGCLRMSKARAIETEGKEPFLTVGEAYYLATSAGSRYFGDADGFAPGNPLHAVVLDESRLPPSARELTIKERFERAMYLADDRSIHAVYGGGRKIK